MLFDNTNLFWHQGSAYGFTAGEFVSFAGVTGSSASTAINLGTARDLGIGDGMEVPHIALTIGTAFTSSLATMSINWAFQGSTDSTTWTTYVETGSLTTASFAAGNSILPIAVPRRPSGVALPLYYRVLATVTGNGTASISTGTVIGGIVIARADNADTLDLYPAGFSVA